jgi:hypothetical protein
MLVMPNVEFATGALALPVWAAGAAIAFFVVIGVLAMTRAGVSVAGALLRVAAVLAAFAAVWTLLEQGAQRERAAERRALDQRAADLAARAIAPGSALACLDAVAGDAVETACEKSVFAAPESVAAAVTYVSARLALLADAASFARRSAGYEGALASLRVAVEADRYGIVAHVLSVRDSCTPLLCDSYVLLHDPGRVQANLRERVFDRYVDRYAPEWTARAQAGGAPVAEAPGNGYTTASGPPAAAATAAAPVSPKYDFPSASSIPAVSIMNPEPGTAPETKPAAVAPVPARKPPQHAAAPKPARAVPAAPQAPQPIGPPPSVAPTAAPAASVH